MKEWFAINYDMQHLSFSELEVALYKTWQAVPEDLLERLSPSMYHRCWRVAREVDGEHLKEY
jgi:hypothetical protein